MYIYNELAVKFPLFCGSVKHTSSSINTVLSSNIPENNGDTFVSYKKGENKETSNSLYKGLFALGAVATASILLLLARGRLKFKNFRKAFEPPKNTELLPKAEVPRRVEVPKKVELPFVKNLKLEAEILEKTPEVYKNPAEVEAMLKDFLAKSDKKDVGQFFKDLGYKVELKKMKNGSIVLSYDNAEFLQAPEKIIKKVYDSEGNLQTTFFSRPFNGSKSELEMFEINSDGIRKLSEVTNTAKGISVKHSFDSYNGVKTEHFISPTENGSRMSYVITDKNGKVLHKIERTFERVNGDENHLRTVVKDAVYETVYEKDKIIVKKFDKSGKLQGTKELKMADDDYFHQNAFVSDAYDLQRSYSGISLEPMYKQIPGDYLYNFASLPSHKIRIGYRNGYEKGSEAIFMHDTNPQNSFILAHEMGHAIDMQKLNLSGDKKLIEILEKEKQEFLRQSTNGEYQSIFYVMQPDEAFAEAYGLLAGIVNNSGHSPRTTMFMKNFPETISYIADKLAIAA